MSALAATAGQETASPRSGASLPDEKLVKWRERLGNARIDRRRYEPVWQLCQSFIQNRQWVGWNYHERRIVELPNPDDRVRVTVNVLTQYLWTFLGKLTMDDLRPDITFRRQDAISRAYARQTRKAFEYGWDEEWLGDEVTLESLLNMGTFGLGVQRAMFDPSYGKALGRFPIDDQGTVRVTDAHSFMDELMQQQQQPAGYHEAREGKVCWRPYTPFGFLPPPGIAHERDFPWVILEQAVSLEQLKLTYGAKADKVQEESLRAVDLIGVREDTPIAGGVQSGMLRGHARLYTGFQMPTVDSPEGEKIVWAGTTTLESDRPLPVQINGQGKAGLIFLKYHPVPGRFWPIGVIEPLVGPQKQRNRARSQWIEMKDRAGLGRIFATKGSVTSVTKPKGGIMEMVEVLPGHDFPKETQGVPPGEWLQAEVAQNDGDLDRVAGLREVSLGQAPAGVSAYSAFALLAEQDDRRVGPVQKHVRLEIAKLTKITLHLMRRHWLPGKMVLVAGDDPDGLLDSYLYDASKIPEDVQVKIGKGAPLPQSQAAQAQKTFDLFDRGISSGQALPLDWLYESLESGRPLPLPKREPQMQLDGADLENNLMAHGQPVQVRPYDNDELHVQRHRIAQSSLSFIPEMQPIVMLLEQHVQEHLQSAMSKAAQASPGAPGLPNGGSAPAPSLGQGGQNAGFHGDQGASGGRPDAKAAMAVAFANRHSPAPPNVR